MCYTRYSVTSKCLRRHETRTSEIIEIPGWRIFFKESCRCCIFIYRQNFLSSFHVALLVEIIKTLHWHRCKDIQITKYSFPKGLNAHHFVHISLETLSKRTLKKQGVHNFVNWNGPITGVYGRRALAVLIILRGKVILTTFWHFGTP